VKVIEPTAEESTVSDDEECCWKEAIDSPPRDMWNEMDSPGRAESGQQYPSIGRTVDTPAQTDPLAG
jgi:hypothetical protein